MTRYETLLTAVHDRIELIRRLQSVRSGLLTVLTLLTLAGSLVPAATAIAFATLVGRVHSAETGDLVAVTAAPLLGYVVILLASHVIGAVREPLAFLASARIDGDHRAEVARLAAMSATIGPLERPAVQELIRLTRADPESFIEGTPGPGVLAQLNHAGRVVALRLRSSCRTGSRRLPTPT